MARQSNWDKLKGRSAGDTLQNRDVYEDQQLGRSKLGEKQTMTSRNVINAALTVVVFFLSYVVVGVLGWMFDYFYGRPMKPFGYAVGHLSFGRILTCLFISGLFYLLMYVILKHNLDVQNSANETEDINQYQNDQHIALPEEVQRKFDWFPDVGATSDVQFSSMISHCAISNKGLKTVPFTRRVPKDIKDEDGDVILFKGEALRDEDDEIITEDVPIIDTDFMNALFTASGLPDTKQFRKFYNATLIEYNPGGKDRDKLGPYDTVADLINADWELPEYEPQRPGGAYLVDVAPVNTMVLAITRAGKGQTVIEPTLDMWTRERRPNNMVINDPKGELLVKFYVRATTRGFQIVQFNLIKARAA